jgi:hypothetical protein
MQKLWWAYQRMDPVPRDHPNNCTNQETIDHHRRATAKFHTEHDRRSRNTEHRGEAEAPSRPRNASDEGGTPHQPQAANTKQAQRESGDGLLPQSRSGEFLHGKQ